ncbi:MAG: DUF3256 family protein [Paludibacteraceae bacterium]|nr:DUF3256 family protein [Paludibacteraceae bacterium]
MLLLDIIKDLIIAVTALHGTPVVEIEEQNYSKIRMADSCYVEVVTYPDSFLVVETICAPICSSRVRVYNKEWNVLHEVKPTYTPEPLEDKQNKGQGIFPYAYFRNDTLVWEDHTKELGEWK